MSGPVINFTVSTPRPTGGVDEGEHTKIGKTQQFCMFPLKDQKYHKKFLQGIPSNSHRFYVR